jgi:hypothetical protein
MEPDRDWAEGVRPATNMSGWGWARNWALVARVESLGALQLTSSGYEFIVVHDYTDGMAAWLG